MAKLILELNDELLSDLAEAAQEAGQSIENWIVDAIEGRLQSEAEEEEVED